MDQIAVPRAAAAVGRLRSRLAPRLRLGTPLSGAGADLAWGGLALAALLLAILVLPGFQTVPFHVIWISFTLLYGFRAWSGRRTLLLAAAVATASLAALLPPLTRGAAGPQIVAEVPLMAAVFGVMVWHARRRQAAVVTANRALAAEREALEREQAFLREASHQLRTPIAVARGYVELAQAAGPDSPDLAEDLACAVAELSRLARVADRLLALSALAAGPLHVTRVDLGTLLRTCVDRFAVVVPRRWRVEVDGVDGLWADADRLEAALDALVENAVAATDEEGLITVRARHDPGRPATPVLVQVEDDGVGFAADEAAHLFDRFYRRTRRDQGSGAGLGLPIVAGVARAHGGAVGAEGTPGQGARFSLWLPVDAVHDNAMTATRGRVTTGPGEGDTDPLWTPTVPLPGQHPRRNCG